MPGVTIQKLGDTVIISPKTNRWDDFFAREALPEDERIPDIGELEYDNPVFACNKSS